MQKKIKIDFDPNDKEKILAFASEDNEGMMYITTYPKDRILHYDTDTAENEAVRVNEFDGILFSDKEYNYVSVTWLTDDCIIEITISDSQDKELVMKIAKGMEYVGNL